MWKPEEGIVATDETTTVGLKPTAPVKVKPTTAGATLRALADRVIAETGDRSAAVTGAYGLAQAVDDLVAAIEVQDPVEAARLAKVVRG